MLNSVLREGGDVVFPAFTGERIYMQAFRQEEGLPAAYARWQPTVDAMLNGITTSATIFLMVDQGVVEAHAPHRRPGLHVDGNWREDLRCHSPGRPGHSHPPDRPWPEPEVFAYDPELLVLASDITASRALVGRFCGVPDAEGSCEALDLSCGESRLLQAHRAYVGTAETVHESLPVAESCQRTLVRLNIPGELWCET